MASENYNMWAKGWGESKVGDTSTNTEDTTMNAPQVTDHDLLIAIDYRTQTIEKNLKNHLSHHWAITVACASAALTGLIGLVSGIVLFLVKTGLNNLGK